MMRDGIMTKLRHQWRSLGLRLMRLYLLLLLIPVAGIGLYGHQYLQRTLSSDALQNGLDDVGLRALIIDNKLGHVRDDMLYLGQRIASHTGDGNGQTDPSGELNGFAASHPTYEAIAWVDDAGEPAGGHLSEPLATWLDTPAYDDFQDAATGTIQFVPFSDPERLGTVLLIVTVRLPEGMLLLEINSRYLLQGLSTEDDTEWAVVLSPNTYLTTSTDPSLFTTDPVIFSRASGHEPVGDRVNLYRRTGPGGDWLLIASLPESAIQADLSEYYTIFLLLMFGGMVSVAGLALFAIARIIDPVYQLERMVDDMRHGNTRPPLPAPVPDDEFGKLMTAFDEMAAELEEKRRKERALVEQIIRAQEEERKLIAYDLHDGLIQQLVGARFYLGQYRNAHNGALDEAPAKNVVRGYDVLTQAIAEGRRIIQGLHPPVLEDLGLEAALSELVQEVAVTASWTTETKIETLATQPDLATSVTLYRITQEALNNAFKHANANHICLYLRMEGDRLCVCVEDNGSGFNTVSVLENGLAGWGLRTMRERASMLRGTCQVISVPGHGTKIEVSIPFE